MLYKNWLLLLLLLLLKATEEQRPWPLINVLSFCFAAMEPRALTRIDVHRFAREAYELGVRYIGGCCGFEPHHIKAIAEEVMHH